MYVTMQTVDEHELVYGPADRFDRMFLHIAVRVQDGDVRSEIPLRQTPQPSSRQRGAKHPSKRSQPLYALVTSEDKRPTARPAPKAGRAIERKLERLHLHVSGSLACEPNDLLRQLTEKEQRDVQQLRLDYLSIEFVGAFERMRQPVNPRGRIGIRQDCKE
jgi:hypothetical protein